MTDNVSYSLAILANPLSDSKAALAIFRLIYQLDIYSKDVDIFLAGFHIKGDLEADGDDIRKNKLSKMEEDSRTRGYHGRSPVFHTYTESTGEMYFNDADFCRFTMDIEDECPGYEYEGEPSLVILPVEQDSGNILCNRVKGYSLEPFFKGVNSGSLDSFLVSLLKLIQRDPDKNSLKLLPKIEDLYSSKTNCNLEDNTTSVIIKIDNQIMNHMHWKEQDDKVFISYSSSDELNAFALKGLLEKNGKNVWIAPDGIPTGADYAYAIPAALRIVSKVIVLLSHQSAHSEFVRKEIGKAISNKKRLFGVSVDGFSVQDLKQYDHLDFFFEGAQINYSATELFDNPNALHNFLEELNAK